MERFPFCVEDLTTTWVTFLSALNVQNTPRYILIVLVNLLLYLLQAMICYSVVMTRVNVCQKTFTFDGVIIKGNATKFMHGLSIQHRIPFICYSTWQTGMCKSELSTKTVTQAVCNSTLPCSEVNPVCTLKGKVVYTNTKVGKIMQYNPDDKSARALRGSGYNSSSDGIQDSCLFKQIGEICSVDKRDFVC